MFHIKDNAFEQNPSSEPQNFRLPVDDAFAVPFRAEDKKSEELILFRKDLIVFQKRRDILTKTPKHFTSSVGAFLKKVEAYFIRNHTHIELATERRMVLSQQDVWSYHDKTYHLIKEGRKEELHHGSSPQAPHLQEV